MKIGPEHRVGIAGEDVVLYPDVLEQDGRLLALERGEVVGEILIDVAPIGRFEGITPEPELVDLGVLLREVVDRSTSGRC